MRGDRELDTYLKAQSWVAKHYRHIIFFALGVAFFSVLAMFIINARCAKMLQTQATAINNLSNKVVFVRADGKVAVLDKQEVTQTYLQYALRDLLANYLVLSAFDLKGLDEFEDIAGLVQINRMVHFLTDKGKPWYKAYLEYIWRNYQGDNLPEVIWINQIRDDLVYQNSRFRYTATLEATVNYIKNQSWNEARGNVVVYLEGYTDISQTTPENPLGIFIDVLEVKEYVGKE